MSAKRWSLRFDRCVDCGTGERRHEARGRCLRCYHTWAYHEHRDRQVETRKARRIRKGLVEREYPRVRAWHEANSDHVREYKRRWHQERGPQPKYRVGSTVWVEYAGFWCEGTITERINRLRVLVRLKGGTELSMGLRNGYVHTKRPEAAH